MTNAQHTPGPWHAHRVNDSGASNGYYQINSQKNGHAVIAVLTDRFNINAGKLETQEANARLIAAAPELLQALEDMVRCYSQHGSNGVIGSACAAIKKAKATKGE